MFDSLKNMIGMGDEEGELDEGLDYPETREKSQPQETEPKRTRRTSGGAEVVLVKPEKFDEATAIGQNLNEHRGVVLNLENCGKEDSRRLVDFLSGVAFANQGNIKRIATSTFLITTPNLELKGEDNDGDDATGGLYFD